MRVRLVPKTKEAGSVAADFSIITPESSRRLQPDRFRQDAASFVLLDKGFEPRKTRHGSVEIEAEPSRIRELFGADLVDREFGTGQYYQPAFREGSLAMSYVAPRRGTELRVPDELSDTIAFAYTPTAPDFFASYVSPATSVDHLDLRTVAVALGATRVHRLGWTGRGIRVAMTDTGFAPHPWFERNGFQVDRIAGPDIGDASVDPNGHGTGESANIFALAPDCTLIGVHHGDYSAQALEIALDQNPRIISNSWGFDQDHQSRAQLKQSNPNLFNEFRDVENIVNDAIADGVTILFSAGNGHRAFPACLPDVIAVGGVTVFGDGSLEASSYASSFESILYPQRRVPDLCGVVGSFVAGDSMPWHIMLPVPDGSAHDGENMTDVAAPSGWGVFSGTSAACPQVAGIVALMLSANPALTPAQVKSALTTTAIDVIAGQTATGDQAGVGTDLATGAGLANALTACRLAAQSAPKDP